MSDYPRLKTTPRKKGRSGGVTDDGTLVKIRKLCRKDRKTLTGLITKFVDKTGQQNLISMIPSENGAKEEETEDKNPKEMLLFTFQLLTDMVKHIDGEITPWFADLIGVSADKFDELPFDVEVDIIDQLISSTKFVDFFFKVSQVRNKIKDLVLRF